MGAGLDANKELTGLIAMNSSGANPPQNLSRRERVAETLKALFAPSALEILDESGAHAGHAAAHPGGETHFRVRMTSAAFAGMSRVARQRAVLSALKDELVGGLHALALELKAADE
ncbi:MAG: BolA family protein [Hyphomonadaceae bacterium]